MRHYCTLFDVNYLANFLALYNSMIKYEKSIRMYAFCMDNQSFNYLSDYPATLEGHITCILIDELILKFPVLSKLKLERSKVEFYFTCSSFISTFVIEQEFSATHVTYLDADLFFFDTPEKIFQELDNSSVGIIEHKFYGRGKRYLKYGTYNVGWVTFKNDEQGRACLKSWKNNCEEWCFDYYDEQNDRFGDQKYLDSWQKNFGEVKVIKQKGANLAPWNVGQYNIHEDSNGKLYIDECPLVFYHFASFKKIKHNVFTTNQSLYLSRPSCILKSRIYDTYLTQLSYYSGMINKSIEPLDILNKNRVAVKQSLKQKINKFFTSIIRWYFNDYIYK